MWMAVIVAMVQNTIATMVFHHSLVENHDSEYACGCSLSSKTHPNNVSDKVTPLVPTLVRG